MVVATVVCGLACLALVFAERAGARQMRSIAKTLASLAFIAVGYLALDGQPATHAAIETFRHIVLIGLVLGAIGDVALLGSSERAFLAGLVAFLLGHLAYVIACVQLVGLGSTLQLAGLYAAIPAVLGAVTLAWLWPHLGAMRIAVIAYVLVIVAMVVGATAVARSDALSEQARTLLLVGAGLFFASDVSVARDKFVERAFVNRAWGLPAYYAGQLLIAWSLA